MFGAMLATPVLFPYVLGWPSLVVPPVVAACAGLLFGLGVHVGESSPGGIAATAINIVINVITIALILFMTAYRSGEVNFSTVPWRRHAKRLALKGGKTYAARCPFTGLRPTVRCPCCSVEVSDLATRDVKHNFLVNFGSEPLRWGDARRALQSGLPLAEARAKLDAALDLRGSHISLSMVPACRGCVAWMRAYRLAPRLALSLAIGSVFFTIAPWAFGSMLADFEAGDGLAAAAYLLSTFYAVVALLVQLQALARSETFLQEYQATIPALVPLLPKAQNAFVRLVSDALVDAKWWWQKE